MQPYFLLLHLHFLFLPFRIPTMAAPGSETAEDFKASPDKILPKHQWCQGPEHNVSPTPQGSDCLGSRPAVTWCSCVSSGQAAGKRAVSESPTRHLSPLRSCIPDQMLTPGRCQSYVAGLSVLHCLPYWSWPWSANLVSYVTLDLPHHYILACWSLGYWLILVTIMDLLYSSCLATIWLPTLLVRSLPCLLCYHTQLPACLSLPSNPLCAPWQVG